MVKVRHRRGRRSARSSSSCIRVISPRFVHADVFFLHKTHGGRFRVIVYSARGDGGFIATERGGCADGRDL